MIIVVDTREKDEYTFGDISTIPQKLDAGDYSVAGLEDRVAIERKSIDDFVGTVIYQKERFHNELCALARMDFAAIVVEASLTDILEHRYKSGVRPVSVIGAAVAVIVEYRVPIIFAGNRQLACHVTQSLLQRYASKHLGEQ
ncbi:MAG TPA: ERCC4 domain-containing protein [bacterium]|nr:ERCC4 domain-containing protein [bacterium]